MTTLACCGNEEAMDCDSDTVISFVNSLGLFTSLAPIPFHFGESIGTQALDIIRGLAFQQRLHKQMTDPRRTGNSVRIAATRHNKTFNSTALSNNESPIRCKGGPTFCDSLNLCSSGSREQRFELLGEIFQHRPIRLD